MEWLERASCRGVADPDVFFPNRTAAGGARQLRAARAICAGCPVARQCLQWAVALEVQEGVCAGTTPEERLALRYFEARPTGRRLRRASC
ncbi:MAG TPA: WhiB family transcriptional regulator [Sporichthyaceae bacterium]|jgi:WhiB family redox-sensing transcriptional regulator|nr:WhiB family transcriptional regulator [Sporichthyaceae bacterium]